jgi:glycosyltransferase involved in cell wall biosynthesis
VQISVLVPARDEELVLPACLAAIGVAAQQVDGDVEVVVALNRCTDRTEEIARAWGAVVVTDDSRSLARIRNTAAAASTGDVIVTIDADSRMSPAMLREIDRLIRTGRYVGGGTVVRPERWSLGIALTGVVLGLVLVRHGVSAAVLWCRREDFEAIGGFDERLVSVEDLDFAKRLKARGGATGRRFATITRAHVVTSTRKFDDLGDWYLLRHPRLVREIFSGANRSAADAFYYDAPRRTP